MVAYGLPANAGSQVGTKTGMGELANFQTTGQSTRGIPCVPTALGFALTCPAGTANKQVAAATTLRASHLIDLVVFAMSNLLPSGSH
jgi:hypothetical protein